KLYGVNTSDCQAFENLAQYLWVNKHYYCYHFYSRGNSLLRISPIFQTSTPQYNNFIVVAISYLIRRSHSLRSLTSHMKKNSIIHRHFFRITIIVIAILVFIRLMLPIILLKTVNKQLAELPGYQGSIEDLRLSLIRGDYGVDGVIFNKRDSATQDTIPFFKAASIDASLEWKSLLKGSLVGEIEIDSPEVRFTRERVGPQTIVKDSSFLLRLADKAMPLAINRFVVENGTLRYIDP